MLSQGLVENPYILGNKFSAADILIAHTLRWAINTGQTIQQANIRQYTDLVLSRVALKRAVDREESASG